MNQKQQSSEQPFIFEVVVREDNLSYFVELNRPQTGKYKVDYYGRCDDPNCIFLKKRYCSNFNGREVVMRTVSGYSGSIVIPNNPSVKDVVSYLKDFNRKIISLNREVDYDHFDAYIEDLGKTRLLYVDNFPYFNNFPYMLNQYTVAHDFESSEYDCDAQYAHLLDLEPIRDRLLKDWNGCGFTVNGRNIYDYDEIKEYFIDLGVKSLFPLLEVMSPTSRFCPFWDSWSGSFSEGNIDLYIEEYYENHYSQIEEYYRIKSTL